MKRLQLLTLAAAATALCAVAATCQPPGERGKGPGKKGPPPPFQPGKVLPPHIRHGLDLTEDQEKQLIDLEKEVKERLLRILTPEQKRKLEELRYRRPGKKGPPDGYGPPGRKGPPDDEGPPRDDEAKGEPARSGIQWYTTWESGLRAAQRSGRPILLVSAAPHCAGVSGIW